MAFRILHCLNQFFAGVGGEEAASLEARIEPGPRGPGRLLEQIDPEVRVIATLTFGDDWLVAGGDEAVAVCLARVREALDGLGRPDLVLAGPSFGAGRYGLACGALCSALERELGVPCVAGMHPDSPGVDLYGRHATIVATEADVMGMRDAVATMLALGRKRAAGEPLDPEADGMLPRGVRENVLAGAIGAERAVTMLLARLRGEPFETEYAMPAFDRVQPASALADPAHARIALVTSGGIVPRGNPDHIESASASRFGEYPLEGDALSSETHQTAHGGYDPTYANADPNRVLPLDAARSLERAGRVGVLHDRYYATVGNGTSVENARRFGAEIAARLVNAGVQAVILTST